MDIHRKIVEMSYCMLVVVALMIATAIFGLVWPALAGHWYGIGWIILIVGLLGSGERLKIISDHFRYRTYVPGYSGQTPAEERNEALGVFAVTLALAYLFRRMNQKDT